MIALGISWGLGLSRTLTIRVVDEGNNPLPEIKVNFGFEMSTATSSPFSTVVKTTNSNGEATASSEANSVGYDIVVPDYYRSTGFFDDPKSVTTVLKNIEHPKAMYARYVTYDDLTFPNDGQPHSYDLIIGDWLPPLGHGITPDFTFQVTGYQRSGNDKDQNLSLTFSNPDDGIQAITVIETGSALRLPKQAPIDGYKRQWDWQTIIDPNESSADYVLPVKANRAYFFRVRSKRDEKGNLTALYGKISHDLNFGVGYTNKMMVQIASYYLNPDGTRLMEFDLNKNLATGESAERVREP